MHLLSKLLISLGLVLAGAWLLDGPLGVVLGLAAALPAGLAIDARRALRRRPSYRSDGGVGEARPFFRLLAAIVAVPAAIGALCLLWGIVMSDTSISARHTFFVLLLPLAYMTYKMGNVALRGRWGHPL